MGSGWALNARRRAAQRAPGCRKSARRAAAPTRQAGPSLVEELLLRAVQLQKGLFLRAGNVPKRQD
eukprot:13697663-Alexandrium_andersonii.AAC.1